MVWIAVFNRISGLANPRGFRTWLFQITRRKALDALRSKRRRLDLLAALERNQPLDAATALPGYNVDSGLLESIELLSPAQREVVALRFWEDMTYPEIAVVIGKPVGTVRSRLYHAKAALRNAMHADSSAPVETDRSQQGERHDG